jgi:hypothetical protein
MAFDDSSSVFIVFQRQAPLVSSMAGFQTDSNIANGNIGIHAEGLSDSIAAMF